MSSERAIFERLKTFAVFAGKLALPYYGKIESTQKVMKGMGEPTVTVIDHSIQELLLAELLRNDHNDIAFNGEEDTHLKFFFPRDYTKSITLHCDPIDGTVPFVRGDKRFCTGYALSRFAQKRHHFFSTVVYDPIDKVLYAALEDEVTKHRVTKDIPKTICNRRCFNEAGREKAMALGYEFVSPGTAHLSIIDVALGRMASYLLWNINVHDALVPFAFAKNYGNYPYDLEGNKLKSFELSVDDSGSFERIPKICFFANDEIKDDLLPLLNNKKYTA